MGKDDDERTRDRDRLFDRVIDPVAFPPDERVGCRSEVALLYAGAASDAKARDRLLDDTFGSKDLAWQKVVLADLLAAEAKDAVFALWKRSEASDDSFRAATRVLAGHVDGCAFAEADVFDRTPQLWKQYPKRRGVLLFLLARWGSERVGWDHFERLFGAKLAQAEVAAYLNEEVDPFRRVHWMWPAFAPGWSRADLIVPRLDAWLDPHTRQWSFWGDSLLTLAEDLCADKNASDSAKLHAWLEEELRKHPSEAQTLDRALERSKPGGCTR